MTRFLGLPACGLDDQQRLAVRVLTGAADELGIARPPLRWFSEDLRQDRTKAWPFETFDFDVLPRAVLVGQLQRDPSEIWLRAWQRPEDLATTVAHEARHAWQGRAMTKRQVDEFESDAETWGRKNGPRLYARASATKSAWLPTSDVWLADSSGLVVEGFSPMPSGRSIKSTTYTPSSQPPLLFGAAQKIGQVVETAVIDERLWERAQLDKHHRYRDMVRRLIEQGMADFKSTFRPGNALASVTIGSAPTPSALDAHPAAIRHQLTALLEEARRLGVSV